MPQTLIIDTDAGTDDAVAILMALATPDVKVAAITTVNGNVALDLVTRNVGIILDAVGAGPIPIYRGAERPLLSPLANAAEIHGTDGLGDTNFPPSARKVSPKHAAVALVEAVHAHPGATLVALGPLTNIALALAIEPELPRLLGKTVIMGGAVHATGNTTPAAEFNIYADPESAAIVFERDLNPTLLTWEATLATPISWDAWERLLASGSLGQRFVGPVMDTLEGLIKEYHLPGVLLPDPLAMAVALDASCAETYPAAIAVDIGHSVGRGMTVMDRTGLSKKPHNARVVAHVAHDPFVAMIERVCCMECALQERATS